MSDGYSYLDNPPDLNKASGADIAKEIRARVADLNSVMREAESRELIVSLEVKSIINDGSAPIYRLFVTVSQEI